MLENKKFDFRKIIKLGEEFQDKFKIYLFKYENLLNTKYSLQLHNYKFPGCHHISAISGAIF